MGFQEIGTPTCSCVADVVAFVSCCCCLGGRRSCFFVWVQSVRARCRPSVAPVPVRQSVRHTPLLGVNLGANFSPAVKWKASRALLINAILVLWKSFSETLLVAD